MFNNKYLIIKSMNYQIQIRKNKNKNKNKNKIFELQRDAHGSKNVTNKASTSPV